MHTRFQQLLDWANERYDLVIIDTPPILGGHRRGGCRPSRRHHAAGRPLRDEQREGDAGLCTASGAEWRQYQRGDSQRRR